MIEPHGGNLVNKALPQLEKERILKEIQELNHIIVDLPKWNEIKNICYGVFSPLKGFMNNNDLLNVLEYMYLENNIAWPIPIILDVAKDQIKDLKPEDSIILTDKKENPLALMNIEEIYEYDKHLFAEKVFRTKDPSHPGVNKVLNQHDTLIGGEIFLLNELNPIFPELDLKPLETRVLFKAKKWNRVVAFQTRNPPHMGHEYVQKAALTFNDGLFINPVIGKKKKGDFLDDVIIESYRVLIKNYYPRDRVVLSIFETEMRYAGPKEAIFHAIVRKNFGCDHIIIGRDHAGVGKYYNPYDAHKIFDEFPDLGIEPLFFRSFSRCNICDSVVNDKICPHPPDKHSFFSGTKIRDILNSGETPNPNIMRPEIAEVILKYQNPFVE